MFERGKKGMEKGQDSGTQEQAGPTPGAAQPEAAPRKPATPAAGKREAAVIGPSIHIDGDLRGEEDLVIEGEVNGTVQLKNNSLTIGGQGKVSADVYAQSVYVEGYMEGDLYGSECVSIRKSAQLKGNITSPRVSLEDGARFKGSIEMDPQAVEAALGKQRGAPAQAADGGAKAGSGSQGKNQGGSGGKPEAAAAKQG